MRAAAGPSSQIDPVALGARAERLSEYLAQLAPHAEALYAIGRDGACVITFTVHGCEERFEDVFALVDASPVLRGWEFHALRPRNAPTRFEAAGIAADLADLRFYYRLANDRIVIAVLTDEAPDGRYRERRAFASAVVAELLGEEDFGRYVADVLMLEYDTWLAATPGGRSAPLAVLGPTFDRIFRRPRSLRRPDANQGRLRLVS
jgi:hypothetical protein